jgi:ATP-dependent RNA helicase DeaD
VTPAEFRKAQRLLQGAKVVADWGAAPSADDVQARDDTRILAHPALSEAAGDAADLAAILLERFGPSQVAAAFVRIWREGRSAPEVLSDALAAPEAARAPRERAAFGPSVWFSLSVGHEGRAEARWLLPKICDAGGIAKDGIGAIRVQQTETFVQIAEADAPRFGPETEIAPGLVMRRLPGEPAIATRVPARTARPDKPAHVPKAPRVVEDALPATPPVAEVAAPPPPRKAPPARVDAPRERKDWQPREGAAEPARKPRWKGGETPAKPGSFASHGARSHGGKDGGRAAGFKSHKAGDGARRAPEGAEGTPRPYVSRKDGPDRPPRTPRPPAAGADQRPPRAAAEGGAKPARSFGKPAGEGKPARAPGFKSHKAEGGGKPAFKPRPKPPTPPADARDTSRRFVPPKKPAP